MRALELLRDESDDTAAIQHATEVVAREDDVLHDEFAEPVVAPVVQVERVAEPVAVVRAGS